MIRVPFNPDLLDGDDRGWWDRWHARAHRGTDALVRLVHGGEPPDFDTSIWADLKSWLYDNVFHNKCAYCEGKVNAQAYGDAEHWRPKGAVTVWSGRRRVAVEQEGTRHPGYWWLAYEWTNLLPACKRCNAGRGKHTLFPVAASHVFDPADIEHLDELDETEQPLLLHPFRGPDPAEHLSFDDLGVVSAAEGSEFGRATIEVFDLNRILLIDERKDRLELIMDSFDAAFFKTYLEQIEWADAMEKWVNPCKPYSLAAKQLIDRRVATKLGRFQPASDDCA